MSSGPAPTGRGVFSFYAEGPILKVLCVSTPKVINKLNRWSRDGLSQTMEVEGNC